MVSQKEIIEALRMPPSTNFFELMRIALVERIESEGIAPPDGLVLVPSEPTDEMADGAIKHLDDDPDPQYYYKLSTANEVYKANGCRRAEGVSDEQ